MIGKRQADWVVETRQVLFGAGDRSHLLDGWSVDERDPERDLTFVWATKLEASVSFEVVAPQDQQFLVKLCAYPTPEAQTIVALVNGHEVSRFTAPPVFLEYRFVVPARWLRRGQNQLTFRHATLGVPLDAPGARRLAAAYASILIGPQCLPLRGWGLAPQPRVRRQEAGKTGHAALFVTGPVAVRRRLLVPPEALLKYRLSLVPPAMAAAVSTLRIRYEDHSRDVLETRLSSSFFGGAASRDVEVDLAPWSGKTVEIEIEIRPKACRAPVTNVVIDEASIFAAETPTRKLPTGAPITS